MIYYACFVYYDNYFFREYICGGLYRRDIEAENKVVIVTGANTGIGKETAWELARRGAKVYMACRDLKRCEKVCKINLTEINLMGSYHVLGTYRNCIGYG